MAKKVELPIILYESTEGPITKVFKDKMNIYVTFNESATLNFTAEEFSEVAAVFNSVLQKDLFSAIQ